MNPDFCPNHQGCQIIRIDGFVSETPGKDFYLQNYCEAGEFHWSQCRRFQTHKVLNLCPNFVLPDSEFDINEILDRLEEE